MQLTHSFTQQLIHAPYAYSFLLIPCLLIAYKPLTKLLPILDKFCLLLKQYLYT